MARYRKKPEVVEAIQFTGTNLTEVSEFLGGIPPHEMHPKIPGYVIALKNPRGEIFAVPDDFIIKINDTQWGTLKPEAFNKLYEPWRF